MNARECPEVYHIEPFDKSRHNRTNFSCGIESLDHYLKKQASQDLRQGIAAFFVLFEVSRLDVLGYYTLSAFGIDLEDLPKALTRKLPCYPEVPATLVGHLAVDLSCQGEGLGEFLLIDALDGAWINLIGWLLLPL